MKYSAQDKVYLCLERLEEDNINGQTALEIAEQMGLTRQSVSHYLTQLYKLEKVKKTKTKPILWKTTEEILNEVSEVTNVLESFIGSDGSLKEEIKQCKAAVNYPPNGLPIIINGSSGVGKSYLATLIYQYAITINAVEKDVPFITLNCADYANNPELLSATLFDYKKGSFTGANDDVSIPLVLHGGSGTGDGALSKAVKSGISKVNLFIDLNIAGCEALNTYISENGSNSLLSIIDAAFLGYKKKLIHYMRLFNSNNKAIF